MLYLFAHREAVMRLLPSGLCLCEVGVQRGLFSRTLVATDPAALHLVDPWQHQHDPHYRADAANVADAAHDDNLAEVRQAFGADPRVTIHRGLSSSVLPGLPQGGFDAVYLDGNHSYQAVLDDLVLARGLVHEDGLLMGHDFCSHWRSRQGGFGVVGAVMEFCKATGADLFALTCSAGATDHSASFSTYLIARSSGSALKRRLLAALLDSPIGMVDLPLGLVGAYNHRVVELRDGRRRYVPSFVM